MFDAKSILDVLVRGVQLPPAPQPQGQGGAIGGGLGGLGEILGKMLPPGGAPQQAPQGGQAGGFGGLGDILGQLQKMGGAQSQSPNAAPQGGQGGGFGGLGDILGELQKMGGAQAQSPHAAPQGGQGGGGLGDILAQWQKQLGEASQAGASQPPQQPHQPSPQGGGSLIDVLGQILGQATAGVKEGAGRINEATGASDRAREALGQATGKTPEELLAQLQEWIRANPGLAAAGAGGLGAILLGTKSGRGFAGGAAKLGALALIGGLAYKAWQNYNDGRPLIDSSGPTSRLHEAAPEGSGFEPDAISNETATLCIRAMVAAAASDGRIDADERRRILGGLEQAGHGAAAQEFLLRELEQPAEAAELAAACGSQVEAVQIYTAARMAIDPDTEEEGAFLSKLAERLGLDPDLTAHIDATAASAAAV